MSAQFPGKAYDLLTSGDFDPSASTKTVPPADLTASIRDVDAEDAKTWAAQWKAAGPALAAVRADELRALDETKNAAIAASFFVDPDAPARRRRARRADGADCGFAIQQSIFLKELSK